MTGKDGSGPAAERVTIAIADGETWVHVGGVVNLPFVLSPAVAARLGRYEVVNGASHWVANPEVWEVLDITPATVPESLDTAPVSDTGRRNIAAAFARQAT